MWRLRRWPGIMLVTAASHNADADGALSGAGGAHLFALANKIGLSKEAYFAVQPIYNGWALFGIVEALALVSAAVLAWTQRDMLASATFAGLAAALIAAALVVFFAMVYPGNVATQNWTMAPDNWEKLRWSWETGHAIEAVLTLLALLATALSVVTRS